MLPRSITRCTYLVLLIAIILTDNPHDSNPIHDVENYEDPSIIFFTPDRKLHAVEEAWNKDWPHSIRVAEYLIKFYEIIDAFAKTIPHLKHIDLNLEIQAIDHFWIRVKSNYKDGILSASLDEAETASPPSDYGNHDW